MEELYKRHELEKQELQNQIKILLKGVKKSQRNEYEAKAIQMEYDLKAKHTEEIEELEERLGIQFDDIAITTNKVDIDELKAKKEQDAILLKKAKAQKKKDKKVLKEESRNQIIEQIRSGAGPSLREIELEKLNEILSKEGFRVKDIASDGNCLYRAISDQINSTDSANLDKSSNGYSHEDLRNIAASYIRSNNEAFAPFLEISPDDPAFEDYCKKVESPILSVWGGQIEIKAIANALKRNILIYCFDSPVIQMGENCDESLEPLRITYHKHYYALGEHYNSVEKI